MVLCSWILLLPQGRNRKLNPALLQTKKTPREEDQGTKGKTLKGTLGGTDGLYMRLDKEYKGLYNLRDIEGTVL